jgi:hypothetical protein
MSALDCTTVCDVAAEFALGVLDGDTRADVVLHLERCGPCRSVVADLSETADVLVSVAPEAEPPPGFQRRVMETLTAGRQPHRWRTAKLVAAVAALVAVTSIVGVRVVDRSRDPVVSAPAVETVAMTGADGLHVGRVEVIRGTSAATLAVTVDYALPDGRYRVALVSPEGARDVLGAVTVLGGRGVWSGSTQLVTAPTQLALVDDVGRVQCSATIPAA